MVMEAFLYAVRVWQKKDVLKYLTKNLSAVIMNQRPFSLNSAILLSPHTDLPLTLIGDM